MVVIPHYGYCDDDSHAQIEEQKRNLRALVVGESDC